MRLPPLANPDRVALLAFAEAVEPPPPIDLNRWAIDNVVFGTDSPKPGAYDPAFYPWNGPILEALGPDDPCQTVVYRKSIQVGGTVVAQIFIGAKQDLDPGPAMFVHPTDSNARRFVRTKLRPFLRNVPALKALFPEKSRDSGASIDFQERRDGRGFMQHAAATSASDLSQISIRDQVQDDLDKWVTDGTTGDPEKNADGRSKAYLDAGTAKILKIGNPVLAHSSRIHRAFERGSQEHWAIPCPSCGALTVLEWEDFKACIERARERFRAEGLTDEDARDAAARDAHMTCNHCAARIDEAQYRAVKADGAMIARNPRAAARVRSFHIWAAYVSSWASIARRWFEVVGKIEAEQTFLNEDAGLPFEAAAEAPDWQVLAKRAEAGHDLGTVPPGGLILVATADCQGDRVEVHVKAFGEHLRRWTVEYVVIPGHIREARAREALDALLDRSWPNAFGHRMRIERFGIDAGAYQGDVREWVKPHSPMRVWMVRGSKDQHAPDLVQQVSRRARREARAVTGRSGHVIHWLGAAVIKGQLYGCLKKDDPLGPDWCGYPKGLPDEFFRQLCAEQRAKRKGSDEYFWEKVYENNEVLDTEVYAQGLAVSLGWKASSAARWEELRRRWETPPDPQHDLFAAPPQAAGDDGAAATSPADTVRLPPARVSNPVPAAPSLAARFAALNDDE